MRLFLSPAQFGEIEARIMSRSSERFALEFFQSGGTLFPCGKQASDTEYGFPVVALGAGFRGSAEYELGAIEQADAPFWTILADQLPGGTPGFYDILRASRFMGIGITHVGLADKTRYFTAVPGAETIRERAELHHRTMLWLGSRNFNIISGTRLGCIGAGGLIFPFAQMAARHGFSSFVIADPETIEASNLNRIIGAVPGDIGKPKTDVLRREMEKTGGVTVETFASTFPPDPVRDARMFESFAGCDILVCGADNDYARVNAQVFALTTGKPLFDMGSGIFLKDERADAPEVDEMGGQVRAALPDGPCLGCMGLDPRAAGDGTGRERDIERGYLMGTGATPPAVITLNSIVASACLSMIVDCLTRPCGLVSAHLSFDQMNYRFSHIAGVRRPDCPICGG